MTPRLPGRVAALVALVLAVAATGCDDDERDITWQEGQRAPGGPSSPGSLDDAQVAALVGLINATEAGTAKAMEPKLAAAAVRAYAARLLSDHTRLMATMPELPGPRFTPPQVERLNAVFHSQAAILSTLPAGRAFDATFLAIQIGDHAMAIDSMIRWRQTVRDGELRRAIDGAMPVMQAHLEAAKALYAAVNGPGATGDTVRPVTPPGPGTVPAQAPPGGHPGPDTLQGGNVPRDSARGGE